MRQIESISRSHAERGHVQPNFSRFQLVVPLVVSSHPFTVPGIRFNNYCWQKPLALKGPQRVISRTAVRITWLLSINCYLWLFKTISSPPPIPTPLIKLDFVSRIWRVGEALRSIFTFRCAPLFVCSLDVSCFSILHVSMNLKPAQTTFQWTLRFSKHERVASIYFIG